MAKIFALAAVAVLTTGFAGLAAEPTATTPPNKAPDHTTQAMTEGHHVMPGNKQHHMSNKMMPSMNPKCSDEAALAKMPADHRAACHRD